MSSLIDFKHKFAETEQWLQHEHETALNTYHARQRALNMLRRRLANGQTAEIILKGFEAAGSPDPNYGYLIQSGRISFPGVRSHAEASYSFLIKPLLDEIAREHEHQLALFEVAA